MKGLSSLERIILEVLEKKELGFEEIQKKSGLHENICFNVIQALIIRGLIKTSEDLYRINYNISPATISEISSPENKSFEYLEYVEALIETPSDKVFKFKKVAMDSRDEKIFKAMLINLESFLNEAHKKAEKLTPLNEQKIIFWGMANTNQLLNQIIKVN